MTHPTAVKTALLADEGTRAAAREALEEFEARQAAVDAADRAAAAEVTRQRQSEYDSEYDDAVRAERESLAAQARAARDGTDAEAAITAVRDLATGSALDDAALAKFLDENGKLL
ncbi:hypothetical protein ACWDA3_27745 [Nonomuraea rubra]